MRNWRGVRGEWYDMKRDCLCIHGWNQRSDCHRIPLPASSRTVFYSARLFLAVAVCAHHRSMFIPGTKVADVYAAIVKSAYYTEACERLLALHQKEQEQARVRAEQPRPVHETPEVQDSVETVSVSVDLLRMITQVAAREAVSSVLARTGTAT